MLPDNTLKVVHETANTPNSGDDFTLIILFVSIVFLSLQFVYTMVTRKWTKEVIDNMTANTKEATKSITHIKDTMIANTKESAKNVGHVKEHFNLIHKKQDKVLDHLADKVEVIHEQVTKTDSDGAPLMFVPRSWVETQKEIAAVCAKTAYVQEAMLTILDRIEARQEKRDRNKG